jgi:CheY-like chemotaxis protein
MMASLLIVDDEAGIREIFRRRFEQEGHEVTEAADGREAIRLSEERQFDLVITDVVMPERDGIEVIQQLRGSAKIIAISGASFRQQYLDVAKILGADVVLGKPIHWEELNTTVRQLLGEKHSDT